MHMRMDVRMRMNMHTPTKNAPQGESPRGALMDSRR
jgi:hypothetical protein